ncbi:MAG TPA: YdcF family protein [Roseiarcus sp.]|nr:YdcF family protein [Roseiarcus sp.]
MFFFASKIFWMIASPVNLLLFGALIGVLMSYGRCVRLGRGLALAAILVLIAAAALPLGMLLIAPLENRFPLPPPDMPPPAGIIVLGGAIYDAISAARGETVFDEGGERLTEAVILAKRYPGARVVYTGGTASFVPGATSSEALQARRFMAQMGIAPERVTIEDKSRTTDENARFTAAIVHPDPSQRWIVVTSAFHMPRAMGLFEKAGFHPIAYPVAFRTSGRWAEDLKLKFEPTRNLRIFELAIHEWIGLAAYWTSGRIDHLFPGP